MLKNKKKSNNYFNNAGNEPSRFVVDLKEQFIEDEKVIEKDQKGMLNKLKLKELYKKYEELDIRDKVNKIKEKGKQPISIDKTKVKQAVKTIVKNSQPLTADQAHHDGKLTTKFFHLFISSFTGLRHWYLMYWKKINSLLFVSLFKFIFSIIRPIVNFVYKFCYSIGWIIVFAIRFIYFASITLFKLIFGTTISITNFSGSLYKRFVIILKISRFKIQEKLKRKEFAVEEREVEEREIEEPAPQNLSKEIEEKDKWDFKKLLPRFSLKGLKPTLIFSLFLILLVLPFKAFTYYKTLDINNLRGDVLGASEEAIDSLLSAGQSASEMNFKIAQEDFSQAATQFMKAQEGLNSVNGVLFTLAKIAPQEDLRLASESKNILAAGQATAELGNNLSLAMDSLFNENIDSKSLSKKLDNFITYGNKAAQNAKNLETILNKINFNKLPERYRNDFKSSREKINFLTGNLNEFVNLMGEIQIFLGSNSYKRYLVVFQNNSEMRATGGFIGSYALVDLVNGEIKNIEVPAGGSYDTEAGLRERIIAPKPLHLVNPLWHFWDANWFPDWPTSAKKLMWFYEKSGGPTVDGVISLTPTALEGLLKVIGSVDMTEKYGVTITSENFRETTRNIIDESNKKFISSTASSTLSVAEKPSSAEAMAGRPSYAKASEGKPKTIIGDLTKKIIDEFSSRLNRENFIGLIGALEKSLDEKHILFYFNDSELQDRIESYGWDGKIKHTAWDYLSVINTNIAGGKSDKKIKETINHEAEIQDDGSIINTLKITRFHDSLKFVDSSGVRNVDWMRIYVPLGSEFIEARGFEAPAEIYFENPEEEWTNDPDVLNIEGNARVDAKSGTKIYEEAGKTVFANWSMVDPGQTINIYIKYKLPFKLESQEPFTIMEKIQDSLNPGQKDLHIYSLLAQKQSGSIGSEIKSTLILPDGMDFVWLYPSDLEKNWEINDHLDTDKYWAAVIEK